VAATGFPVWNKEMGAGEGSCTADISVSHSQLFSVPFFPYYPLLPVLFQTPCTLSIKFLAESFFLCSLFGEVFPRSPALLRCRPNTVSALSTVICLRAEEGFESHVEKEYCIESDSNGFLVGVIELDFAFNN
jgi:hypothetical protein